MRIVAGLVIVAAAGVVLGSLRPKHNPKIAQETNPVADLAVQQPPTPIAPVEETPQPLQTHQRVEAPTISAPPQVAPPVPQAEPTPQTRQLVSSLVKLEPQNGILTDDFAKRWKQNLQQLVQQGSAGIPAIQEFLRQNLDYAFGDTGRQLLGYSSARGAMFDALAQIGGAQAVAAMTGVLQTTGDPREIALLAQSLEKLDPGQHQQEVVNAAEQALALAREQKSPTMDVAPLFEVLQKYGGAAVVGDLQNAARQWNYYAPIALGQLPDGAGIPTLLQMAQDPNVTGNMRSATLLSLAQVFDQSPEARAALEAQARANSISGFAWVIMAPVLAGDRVEFYDSAFDNRQGPPEVVASRSTSTSDNQRFYSIPVEISPAQGSQRLAFIDEMLAATSDPDARVALQQSRSQLANRLSAAGSMTGP
jgi:HEAT repeat protein